MSGSAAAASGRRTEMVRPITGRIDVGGGDRAAHGARRTRTQSSSRCAMKLLPFGVGKRWRGGHGALVAPENPKDACTGREKEPGSIGDGQCGPLCRRIAGRQRWMLAGWPAGVERREEGRKGGGGTWCRVCYRGITWCQAPVWEWAARVRSIRGGRGRGGE